VLLRAATTPPLLSAKELATKETNFRGNPVSIVDKGTQATSAGRGLVAMMALATGVVIANLYYAQPLEDTLAREFGASPSVIGLIIMVTQIGYAVGLATLVPLGDLLERQRLLASMLTCTVLGLVAAALAPSLALLGCAAVLIGLTSVAAQVIVPFAAHLADEGRQGQAVSSVMSGLLLGILLSRTVSGLVAEAAGWRAVYALGAVATAMIAVALWRTLPVLEPTARMRYSALLASVVRIVREEPVLRLRILYGALVFASFSAFWASVGFLLARPPYSWSDAEIGVFALLGVAGALAAKVAGRLKDRGLASMSTGAYVLIMTVSFVLMGVASQSIGALAVGVVLMDFGCQAVHISNQGLVYPLRPDARSRLNTAYMTTYFVAGALGTGASAIIYSAWGWTGVCVLGGALPAVAVLLWVGEMLWGRPQYRSP
jgi:predicted MFS family arabinose efflux permease